MESLEFYLLGRQRQSRRTAEDNLKSIEYFRRAVDADPAIRPGAHRPRRIAAQRTVAQPHAARGREGRSGTADQSRDAINPNLPEVLAVKGWLLTEEFRFDEALPLLLRATKLNPNDASSHRFLGNLYDRRAQPGEAMEHFSLAAQLDPLDFISHVFRCMELVDLGEFKRSRGAPATSRASSTREPVGPAADRVDRARAGQDRRSAEVDRRGAQARARTTYLAGQKIELLLTLGQGRRGARGGRELPAGDSFFGAAREGGDRLRGRAAAEGLKAWLAERGHASARAATGAELAELARLQFIAGEPGRGARHARACRAHPAAVERGHVRRQPDPLRIFGGADARRHRARGGGDKAKAMQILAKLDRMLDTYEKNGGTHFGVYALRAESLALQGKTREAQAALKTAWKRGWRAPGVRAREPYLQGVDLRWIEEKRSRT